MSAHAITGPSWRPWDSPYAKGVTATEMSLPERPDDRNENGEISSARQLTHEEYAEQIASTLSADLFAAVLEQQEYHRHPSNADSHTIADGAQFIPGQTKDQSVSGRRAESGDATNQTSEDSPERQRFGGVTVITSGHSLDNRPGVSLLQTRPDLHEVFSPELQAQLARDLSASDLMTIVDVEPAQSLPPGASSYMAVTPGALSGAPTAYDLTQGSEGVRAQAEDRAQRFLDLMDAEKEMQDLYGADAKLAYSHTDGGYIMLTRDDGQYQQMASARDGVGQLYQDIQQGRLNPNTIRDRLAVHGFNV